MKQKILMLVVAAMLMVASALPALAQQQPADPVCGWYFEGLYYIVEGEEWWGYWCYWPDEGWILYSWWEAATGKYYMM